MDIHEAIGRRYCAFRGENPDEVIEGRPIWQHAVDDVRIAMNVLETFQIDTGTQPLFESNRDGARQLQLGLPSNIHGLKKLG